MKILITGSNGFVGSNITENLNTHDIYGIGHGKNLNLKESNFFDCDITDFEKMREIFSIVKPEILIHLAAIVHKNNNDVSEKNYNLINFESSKNLFDLCKEFEVGKIVFASTIEVYGNIESNIVDEETICNPNSFYGLSKYKAEQYLSENFENYFILRFTPLYGKDFTLNVDKRVFLKKDKVAYYLKKGDYSFDFCSILNVCDFISTIVENEKKFGLYLLSDTESITIKDIIKYHKKYKNLKFVIKMPYYLTIFTISIIDKLSRLFSKKDVYLSVRNFNKLFVSKKYNNKKTIENITEFKWNIENTIFKDGAE